MKRVTPAHRYHNHPQDLPERRTTKVKVVHTRRRTWRHAEAFETIRRSSRQSQGSLSQKRLFFHELPENPFTGSKNPNRASAARKTPHPHAIIGACHPPTHFPDNLTKGPVKFCAPSMVCGWSERRITQRNCSKVPSKYEKSLTSTKSDSKSYHPEAIRRAPSISWVAFSTEFKMVCFGQLWRRSLPIFGSESPKY